MTDAIPYSLVLETLFEKDFKDFKKLRRKDLQSKLNAIFTQLEINPYLRASQKTGDLQGFLTRSLDKDYRLMYQIDEENLTVILHQLNTHDVVYSTRRKQQVRD